MNRILLLMHHAESTYWFKRELVENLIKEGYEVHISVPDCETLKSRFGNSVIFYETKVDRRGMNPIEDIKLYLKYKKIIYSVMPSVILTAAIKPNIYGNLAAKSRRIPVISNVTGVGTSFQKPQGFKFKLIKFLYRKAFAKAHKVFFENTDNGKIFLKYNLININQVIYVPGTGVNMDWFYPIATEGEKEKTVFLLIGRIMKDKGTEEYLEASKILSGKYSNVKFEIVGMIEETGLLQKILENKFVSYLGWVEDPRVEIAKADCIVLPSYHEGMANTLLEGAAMEKPLIASNISGCKEAIDPGSTGFICEPKDVKTLVLSMEKIILMEKSERANMGIRGRQKMLKEFDRKIVVKKYMEEIENVIINGKN